MAFDADSKIIGLRADTLANMGAYLSTFAPCDADLAAWHAACRPVHDAGDLGATSRRCSPTPCRSTPIAAQAVRKRPISSSGSSNKAAQELGVDQAELRRKNFIQPNQFPYQTPVAVQYDIGDYEASAEQGDGAGRLCRLRGAPRGAAKGTGKLRGIGLASYIEACGIAPSSLVGSLGARAGLYEAATIRVNPTGSRHGLDRPPQPRPGPRDHLRPGGLRQARHSAIEQYRHRAWRHRQGAVRHGHLRLALARGRRHRDRQGPRQDHREGQEDRRASARSLGGATSSFENGSFTVEGHGQVARPSARSRSTAYVPHNIRIDKLEPGLEETAFYDPKNFTFPAGTYICEVEIDPKTGRRRSSTSSAADDFGNVINPMIVEGQVHGGIVQGIGQALLEHAVYDDERPAADRLLHGLLHAARRRCAIVQCRHQPGTPCTHNPLGVKGCGEAGAIGCAACGGQCHRRCAEGLRRRPYRHAGDAGEGLAGDQPGGKADGGGIRTEEHVQL